MPRLLDKIKLHCLFCNIIFSVAYDGSRSLFPCPLCDFPVCIYKKQ